MNLITIVIGAALLITAVIVGMGFYSMVHGDKFDKQIKLAKIGTDVLTFWILVIAIYLLYRFIN